MGDLVICETDEITRVICGYLIRVILDTTSIKCKDLWPIDANSALYAGFPQSGFDWKSQFQVFVDEAKQVLGAMSPNIET